MNMEPCKIQKRMTTESENWIDIIDYNLTMKKGTKYIKPFFSEEDARNYIATTLRGDADSPLYQIVPIQEEDAYVAQKTR